MEPEVQVKMIPNKKTWRSENMKKANEVRMRAIRERKELAAREVSSVQITDNEIETGLRRIIDDSATNTMKSDFYRAFYEVGGVKAIVKWIKAEMKNQTEYYKMFIGLLKSESIKQTEGQKQQVVVNIIAPNNEKREITISGRVEESNDKL